MNLFQEPLVAALGWTLVHFLWQGALIGLLLALADAAFEKSGARARYAVACGAMALMALSAAATFLWFRLAPAPESNPGASVSVPGSWLPAAVGGAATQTNWLEARLAGWLPWLDCLWLAGVLVLSCRSTYGWMAAQRLKNRDTTPVEPLWETRLRRMAEALRVSRPVRISKSALARVPAVVGWLRPVILVPAGALAGVDAQQLEALLAHELAHVRRHDYLVNLIQTVVETFLFYHPAVWWAGRRIRIERENCCDDLAVSACGNVLTYARALTRLEELRTGATPYAMAAGGGSLLTRIRRLLAAGKAPERTASTWLFGLLATAALCIVWTGAHAAPPRQDAAAGGPQEAPSVIIVPIEAGVEASPAAQESQAPRPAASGSYIGSLADAGYPNLTVDQLIAFKIQGVTPEYILQLRDAGMTQLTPDQLIAFRIHKVDPQRISNLKSTGFAQVTPDQVVAMQIHGATPEFAAQMAGLGLGRLTVDQLVAARIHNVTPEYAGEMKKLGLAGITIDQLIAFRIHGVDGAQLREMQSLGPGMPTADQAVALRIHQVTPEYVRALKDAGLTKLGYDDLIAARIHGITPDFLQEATKHGFKNLTLDQLIRLKQIGIL